MSSDLLLVLGGSVLHLGVTLSVLPGVLLVLGGGVLGGLLGSELGAALGGGGLLSLTDNLALGLDLLLVALDDGAGDEADFIHLGDIDGLGGVVAILIKPVLEKGQYISC